MTAMPKHVTTRELVAWLERGIKPPLIAIDGLPCSGKSTLANKLKERFDFECVYLDDFVLPEKDWPSRLPAFPFGYIRYDEFLSTVKLLSSLGECSYHPFDWKTFSISADRRIVTLARPVIIEGLSSLHPDLCSLYGLRIFLESDRATVLESALSRGTGPWADAWRELFLPSADIYMQSQPEKRADMLVAGRGISQAAT